MPTVGNFLISAALAVGLVLCIGTGGFLLFWVANVLERDLNEHR
jgi:ABC-type phosphate transport system auxiliary subunit